MDRAVAHRSARLWCTFCSFPGLTNWRAKTASTKTSSECSRLTDWRTSTSFHRLLCFPTSIRNSAVRPFPPFGAGWQSGEMLPEHLHLAIRLFCQRQGPMDHQTSSIFQRARHLLGQQREWLLHQIQKFDTFNVHIIALVSPDVAPAHKKRSRMQELPIKYCQLAGKVISSPPRGDHFAAHLNRISSRLTRWHHSCCLHCHWIFPAASPGLSLSTPARGKPSKSFFIRTILHPCTWIGSRNSGNKVSLTKMGHSEEKQHLCPRLSVLKILAF